MKILVCDKTEKEYIEQMRAAGLTVDVRDDITPEELPSVLPAYDGMDSSITRAFKAWDASRCQARPPTISRA